MRRQHITALAMCLTGGLATADVEFEIFDVDKDGSLSRDEYHQYAEDNEVYADWDIDADGFIDEVEYDALDFDDEWHAWDIDGDGYVDSGEYHDGIFGTFDEDGDGRWNVDEWEHADNAGF